MEANNPENSLLTDTMNNIWNNIISIGPPEGSTTTAATNTDTASAKTGTSTITASGTMSVKNSNSLSSLLSFPSNNVNQQNGEDGRRSTEKRRSGLFSSGSPKEDTNPIVSRKPSNSGPNSTSWLSPNIGDKLIEKLMESALASASVNLNDVSKRRTYQKSKPTLSVPLTANHYRNFQTRCGIFFEAYYVIQAIVLWESIPTTLSFLSLYSFICLDPRLIVIVPLLYISLGIMVPAYLARHPGPKSSSPSDRYSSPALGLPLSDPIVPKPVPEFSIEFYMNIIDTQNSMGDFIEIFDGIIDWLATFAYFADERWSSFVYLSILTASLVVYITMPYWVPYIPWKLVFMFAGWMGLGLTYLKINAQKENSEQTDEVIAAMKETKEELMSVIGPHIEEHPKVKQKLDSLIDRCSSPSQTMAELHSLVNSQFDYISPHEQREVQAFEIQQFDKTHNCWSPSIYYGTPYAHMKLASEPLPAICPSVLSEIKPPEDWTYISDQWNLDYSPQDWVNLHCLEPHVYIDHDEKWVYDSYNGVKSNTWRRRRWVRVCSRMQLQVPKPAEK